MNHLLVLLLIAQPTATGNVELPRNFSRLECYRDTLFLAPRIGTSIFKFAAPDSMIPISFTDEINYRIYDFRVTPFAIYINRGKALEKYFVASGEREVIYKSQDISSFTLTPTDEIVLADRQTQELIFLDFRYQVKFKIANVNIEDIQWRDTLIYALSPRRIQIYDEYGNLIDTISTPEWSNRIITDRRDILVFAEQNKNIYRAGVKWQRIEFPFAVSDMCLRKNTIVILDGTGNYLHCYSRDEF
jgi:hypothetical protein